MLVHKLAPNLSVPSCTEMVSTGSLFRFFASGERQRLSSHTRQSQTTRTSCVVPMEALVWAPQTHAQTLQHSLLLLLDVSRQMASCTLCMVSTHLGSRTTTPGTSTTGTTTLGTTTPGATTPLENYPCRTATPLSITHQDNYPLGHLPLRTNTPRNISIIKPFSPT